jgi:hypothetical protein
MTHWPVMPDTAESGALRQAVDPTLARYRVEGFLHIRYQEQLWGSVPVIV